MITDNCRMFFCLGIIVVTIIIGFISINKKEKPNVCLFCGKADDLLRQITDDAYYGFAYYYYHTKCWREILKDPEKYTNKEVDSAIEISDSLRERYKRIKNARNFIEKEE